MSDDAMPTFTLKDSRDMQQSVPDAYIIGRAWLSIQNIAATGLETSKDRSAMKTQLLFIEKYLGAYNDDEYLDNKKKFHKGVVGKKQEEVDAIYEMMAALKEYQNKSDIAQPIDVIIGKPRNLIQGTRLSSNKGSDIEDGETKDGAAMGDG